MSSEASDTASVERNLVAIPQRDVFPEVRFPRELWEDLGLLINLRHVSRSWYGSREGAREGARDGFRALVRVWPEFSPLVLAQI